MARRLKELMEVWKAKKGPFIKGVEHPYASGNHPERFATKEDAEKNGKKGPYNPDRPMKNFKEK